MTDIERESISTDDSAGVLEEIRERTDRPDSRSTVDGLLGAHYCEEEDLVAARRSFEDCDEPTVVALFQLPYRIHVAERWLPLSQGMSPGEARVRIRPTGTPFNPIRRNPESATPTFFHETGFRILKGTANAELPGDRHGFFVRSQVLMSLTLWRRWYEKYERYLELILTRPREAIYPNSRVKTKEEDALWTAELFEAKLAARVRDACLEAINSFLRVYRVVRMDGVAAPVKRLDCFIMMNRDGRLVTLSPTASNLELSLKPFRPHSPDESDVALEDRLVNGVPPTIYEESLLTAVEQVEMGAYSSAVVQAEIVLEWFFNSLINEYAIRPARQALDGQPGLRDLVVNAIWGESGGASRGRNVGFHQKMTTYLDLAGIRLGKDSLKDLRKLMAMRNDIVHDLPSATATSTDANWAIRLAMDTICDVMKQLRTRQPAKVNSREDR